MCQSPKSTCRWRSNLRLKNSNFAQKSFSTRWRHSVEIFLKQKLLLDARMNKVSSEVTDLSILSTAWVLETDYLGVKIDKNCHIFNDNLQIAEKFLHVFTDTLILIQYIDISCSFPWKCIACKDFYVLYRKRCMFFNVIFPLKKRNETIIIGQIK